MVAAVAVGRDLEKAGVVLVALLAAAAILGPTRRVRALATLAALGVTPVLLVAEIWSTPQFRPIRDRPALAVALLAGGVALVAAGARLIEHRPLVLPLAAVAVLPFRVPIASGGESANLLVPLYLIIAAGAIAFALADLRGRDPPGAGREPGRLEWLLLGFVALYAIQATYSSSFSKALEQVVFFYVPFALLFALLVRYEWTPRLLVTCLGILAGLGVVLTGIGAVEYATRTLLLNPKVISANQFQPYFRVNSLFFDPNIFGRFMAIVMVLLAAALLWARRRRDVLLVTAALAVLWAGLVLTLSQSSLGALLVGLAVLGGLRYRPHWAIAASATAAVLGVGFVLAFPNAVRLRLTSEKSISGSTSGRADLVRGGVDLFADRPVLGWGSGAFAKEFRRERNTSSERAAVASHTIPVTVAAEQGVAGLLVYLALLAAAFGRLLRGARGSPARAGLAAAFAVLVWHTLGYAAFLEDPLAWALLAVGTVLAPRAPPPARDGPEPAVRSAACTAT